MPAIQPYGMYHSTVQVHVPTEFTQVGGIYGLLTKNGEVIKVDAWVGRHPVKVQVPVTCHLPGSARSGLELDVFQKKHLHP